MHERRECQRDPGARRKIILYLGLVEPLSADDSDAGDRLVASFKNSWRQVVVRAAATFSILAPWDRWRWTVALPASLGIAVLWLALLVAVQRWRGRGRPPVSRPARGPYTPQGRSTRPDR